MRKGAIISECKRYRSQLWRIWDESKPFVLFIMLNPSKADESEDDPTIRRCIGFAKSWGYGGIYVGNLFAFRATNPKELFEANYPIGPENDWHLAIMSSYCEITICAWGNSSILRKLLPDNYKPLDRIYRPIYSIELSKDGTPKHPLYLKGDLKPKPYETKRLQSSRSNT